MDLSDFFQEYSMKKNLIFATVEIKNNKAKIFLKTKIEGKNFYTNMTLQQVYRHIHSTAHKTSSKKKKTTKKTTTKNFKWKECAHGNDNFVCGLKSRTIFS